jgi:hypothetical protein
MSEESYQDRVRRRIRQEHTAFENDAVAKAQAELDFHWQCRLDAEAALREESEWVEVGGFRERRHPTCHRSRRDPDYWR